MARIGSVKRVDPKAKGTAFRKANKRPREEDSEKESRKKRPNDTRLKQQGSSLKNQGKKAPDATERSKPNQAKPFKGNKVAQKPTKESQKSKPPSRKTRPDQNVSRTVRSKKERPVNKQESSATKLTHSLPQPADVSFSSKGKSKSSGKVKKQATTVGSNEAQRGMRIVVGSYERFLYGLAAFMQVTPEGGYECVIEPQFVFPAHVASIRAVACAGDGAKWLCTGGTDETIKVWDLRRKKEVGALIGHEGTITTLCFPSRTIMMSAGEDGVINMYRVRDWSLLRTLRGHTGRINSASVHPSGRIALSVGADRTIRMWDLMRGVGASSVKIGVAADRIEWDTLGKRFAVMAGSQVMLFATDLTKLGEIEQPKRLHDICFTQVKMADGQQHELLCVACETGVVNIYDLDNMQSPTDGEQDSVPSPKEIGQLVGHENRVKVVPVAVEDDTISLLATTISSDGWIRVFNMTPLTATEEFLELESIASYDTKHSRLTCLSAVGFDPDSTAAEVEEDTEDIDQSQILDVDHESLPSESEAEADEDSEEELARLEKEVQQAKEAGVVVDEEGNIVFEEDDDEDHDEGQDTDSSMQQDDQSDQSDSPLESEEEQEDEQEQEDDA
ncbi:Protein mak11 [Malassezia psittaci]|uniref:Protein mak11 n=1 Tax=Malassezia psittaci TaxID=1821823 RepID=A0AAF0FBR7_9BASI|nr:Protein mak11 [Malassezia psittaci]